MKIIGFSVLPATLLCFVMALSSCDKPEEIAHNPREKVWWGYFDGTFDGTSDTDDMRVSFENDSYNQRTRSGMRLSSPTGEYGILIMQTRISVVEETSTMGGSYIEISLSGLFPGVRYITKPYRRFLPEEWVESTLMLERRYSTDPEPVVYVPSPENPFKVEILDIEWFSDSSFPAVEAKLSGTLYRKDNPQEYITAEAVCGFR